MTCRAPQSAGVCAADVLHEDWQTIQGVTYYDLSRIHILAPSSDETKALTYAAPAYVHLERCTPSSWQLEKTMDFSPLAPLAWNSHDQVRRD